MPEDMFSHGAAHISHVIVSKCRKTNKPKLVSSGVANTHLRTCVVGTEFSLFACTAIKSLPVLHQVEFLSLFSLGPFGTFLHLGKSSSTMKPRL